MNARESENYLATSKVNFRVETKILVSMSEEI
jgi:hypothetical protein